MTWPGLDYHNHICAAPIEAMIASAAARGVHEFGITEHVFMLYEGQALFPGLEENGERFSRDWYVRAVRDRDIAGVVPALRLGLEVDYLPGTEDAVAPFLASVEWDFLLGSVHAIDGTDLFEYVPSSPTEGQRLWERYFELTAEAIECGMFDVITHPVRNAERNPHLPARFDRMLEEVAAFARLHGVALELNGYDTVTWPELVERLARACGRAGCVVSFGSDAHQPANVAAGLADAARMAVAAGVRHTVSFERRERRIITL